MRHESLETCMAGTYLLDTAPLVYLMGKEDSVPPAVRRELSDPKSEVFYSQISLWEIQIKYQIGKLPMPEEPATVLPREIAKYDFTRLALTDAAIFGLSQLPPIHRDPFDRLLVSQARLAGLVLVSPDKVFSKYPVECQWD